MDHNDNSGRTLINPSINSIPMTAVNPQAADGSMTAVNPQAAGGSMTAVNPQAADGSMTMVNPQVADGSMTAVNPQAAAGTEAVNLIGTVISGKYKITSRLDVRSGEADLYLSEYEGNKYVVKVYRRKIAVKPEVISRLKALDSPFIAKLCETGEIGENTFEVTPYYKNGNLQGHKYSLAELKEKIIPDINEGLKILHSMDIIHKDIKPSNVMLSDDGNTVSIIDFGISSVKDDGATVIVTKTGMTPEYSALETFRGIFLDEADYYSFGILIYELFCGRTPYANMSPEEIEGFNYLQCLPFPEDMPQELKELISGLTYNDLNNRHDKSNPNRRWTYEEVSNWLKGIKQPVPGTTSESTDVSLEFPPYTFHGHKYTNRTTLARAMAENWDDGKNQVRRGLVYEFFKSCDPELAGYCLDAKEAIANGKDDDAAFLEMLMKMTSMPFFCWKGRRFADIEELGKNLLETLWNGNKDELAFFEDIITSDALEVCADKDVQLKEISARLKTMHQEMCVPGSPEHEKEKFFYMMGYMLSGERIFYADGHSFSEADDLLAFISGLYKTNAAEFELYMQNIIRYDNFLSPQLQAWFLALGKRNILDEWGKLKWDEQEVDPFED
ncbi:MAG: protein kinase [bacterium]|nr:protein kinase [bacterium]